MSEATYKKCPICNSPAKMNDIPNISDNPIFCYRCGEYRIKSDIDDYRGQLNQTQIANFSGWIRENQRALITPEKYELLKDLNTPEVGEKATKLLKYIATELPIPGQKIQIDFTFLMSIQGRPISELNLELRNIKKYLLFLSITWSNDGSELKYLVEDYLIKEKEYLAGEKKYKITPKGWAYLDKIRNVNPHNNSVFIASKYEKEINDYLDNYVVTALEELRYKPKLMRSHPHTNIIDNEMISLIKQSKFIIVDLTENSLGAYYEAGYAQGFGLDVIYTCEKSFRENKNKDKLKGVHFDTSHYPISDWEYGDGPGFKERLYQFIDVKFGKGTYNPD